MATESRSSKTLNASILCVVNGYCRMLFKMWRELLMQEVEYWENLQLPRFAQFVMAWDQLNVSAKCNRVLSIHRIHPKAAASKRDENYCWALGLGGGGYGAVHMDSMRQRKLFLLPKSTAVACLIHITVLFFGTSISQSIHKLSIVTAYVALKRDLHQCQLFHLNSGWLVEWGVVQHTCYNIGLNQRLKQGPFILFNNHYLLTAFVREKYWNRFKILNIEKKLLLFVFFKCGKLYFFPNTAASIKLQVTKSKVNGRCVPCV